MGATGFSSEEKIKILYEESLKDIREIVKQCEAVTARLEEANKPNALLAGISKETALLVNLDKSLVQSADSLLGAVQQVISVQQKYMAEQLALAGKHLGETTDTHLLAITQAARVAGTAECQKIEAAGREAVQVQLKALGDGAERILRERVAAVTTKIDDITDKFHIASVEFQDALDQRRSEAARVVQKFDAALAASVERLNAGRLGGMGQLISIVASGCAGAIIGVFLLANGVLPLPEKTMSQEDIKVLKQGRKLSEIWPNLDAKTQEKIIKLFQQ